MIDFQKRIHTYTHIHTHNAHAHARSHIRTHTHTIHILYTFTHTYTHIWMWNAFNQTIVKFLYPCKSCFLSWKLRFSVASPPYKIGSWPREILCVDEIRSRPDPSGRFPTPSPPHAPTPAHLHDSAWFCLVLSWKSINDRFPLDDQAENHYNRWFTMVKSINDRFSLDNQAENHHKRSFPYLKSTNDWFSLDNQTENHYKRAFPYL